ncbi:Hypothetical protein SRAE_2000446500 [Strongyloides ratti]|uniref:Uncharacterized protein n=1 Tax=Strongyloides ratti TaxID=34506 RepID=A0A090LNR9_STRRB|nr:Hypothetical protein SRAE_2000446500 [Strongyloides ratti]CEF69819.1 Hypothetical protein SRAE_2000446500 [Strongyloides ratti]
MMGTLKKDIENTLEIVDEYQYLNQESGLDKLEFSLDNILAYISDIKDMSELYHTNKLISLMYSTMLVKISTPKIKQNAFNLLMESLLVVLKDNEDLRLLFVNDYDMITTISKSIHLYTDKDDDVEAFLENILNVLQILSIEGFTVSDEGILDDLLQFLIELLVKRENNNIRKFSSRLITNICFTYPQCSKIVLANSSFNSGKKILFNDVVFQVPSIMTSFMSFLIRFDNMAKQNLSVNDNLLKILLFSFNALKTDETYLKVYVGRFIIFLIFDENFNLSKLGETWSTKKYAKMSIKETFKILPTISKRSEDLGVMYRLLHDFCSNKKVKEIVYDIVKEEVKNQNNSLFNCHVINEIFKVASNYNLPRRIPEETRINGGHFICKMIEESIKRNEKIYCEGKKNNLLEYLKSLVTGPVTDVYETPERIRVEKLILFLKLCISLSADKSFADDIPKIFTNRVADQIYELPTKYFPRMKLFLRHKGETVENKILNSIRLIPFLLKALNAYEKCAESLNYILSKLEIAEFLSVGLMSRNLELMKEVICCFEISLPPHIVRQIVGVVKNFIDSDKVNIESISCTQDTVKELKEQLDDTFKVCESYKSQIDKLKEEMEELKENHQKIYLEQSKMYDDLKKSMEKVTLENQLLSNLKENMKNLLL